MQLDDFCRLYQDLVMSTSLRNGRLVGIAPASALETGGDCKRTIASKVAPDGIGSECNHSDELL